MKGTERDERVSRFLDESDKGYAVLLFILAQRKEIKKNIVNRLKPSQKLVSFAFVSAKLSTLSTRARAGPPLLRTTS